MSILTDEKTNLTERNTKECAEKLARIVGANPALRDYEVADEVERSGKNVNLFRYRIGMGMVTFEEHKSGNEGFKVRYSAINPISATEGELLIIYFHNKISFNLTSPNIERVPPFQSLIDQLHAFPGREAQKHLINFVFSNAVVV